MRTSILYCKLICYSLCILAFVNWPQPYGIHIEFAYGSNGYVSAGVRSPCLNTCKRFQTSCIIGMSNGYLANSLSFLFSRRHDKPFEIVSNTTANREDDGLVYTLTAWTNLNVFASDMLTSSMSFFTKTDAFSAVAVSKCVIKINSANAWKPILTVTVIIVVPFVNFFENYILYKYTFNWWITK